MTATLDHSPFPAMPGFRKHLPGADERRPARANRRVQARGAPAQSARHPRILAWVDFTRPKGFHSKV
jgi:hypothetical protein